MRVAAVLFFAFALFAAAQPARADINQNEAGEIARNNNCAPKKIDVYRQSVGTEGDTVYRVACNLPKTADANAPKAADALLISCNENLCELLRPLESEGK